MKNVYDEIRLFYEDSMEWEPIVKREWVEGFLRQKAWQGVTDSELRTVWRNIEMFILYLVHAENDSLDELTPQEYSIAVEWLAGHIPDYSVSIESVRNFFEILKAFYAYLYGKKLISGTKAIERAAEEIAGGDTLKLIDSGTTEFSLFRDDFDGAFIPDDLGKRVGETVERLMVKIGSYFQREQFSNDFDRALYLYTGPFDNVPENDQDEFWLGFWDYFLFDYHLIESDEKPLRHFYDLYDKTLSGDERQILQDLMHAQFTVFYINKILGPEWVECIDLFSGATMKLPYPDFEFNSLKKILFYGHMYSGGVVMLNYVISVEVSPILRQRIKDEILRQKLIYEIQCPAVTVADFFDRHALVVRHTIDVLVTLAKVNVTSAFQFKKEFPEIHNKRTPDAAVASLLLELGQEYGFSAHDLQLASKLWHDFSQLAAVTIRKPGVWAAAVLYAFAQINGTGDISPEELADHVSISLTSLKNNRNKLFDTLQLQKFDPRYLSEEGFVLSLFVL